MWTDIGNLGGGSAIPSAINNNGQISGWSTTAGGPTHAFLWDSGILQDLGELVAGQNSFGEGLNNAGNVVGIGGTEAGQARAFVWNGIGMASIGTLGGPSSTAFDANDPVLNVGGFLTVQIVGVSRTQPGTDLTNHAFLWTGRPDTAVGSMVDLGTLPGQDVSDAVGINNAGQVAGTSGSRAFIWQANVMTDIGTLGGANSLARRINENGHIVGRSATVGGEQHAFLWNGSMQDLGTLGGADSEAQGLNDGGVVVGNSRVPSGQIRAFVWEGGTMTDLNSILINALPAGVFLNFAYDINNDGWIVATGTDNKAYLLTPVSEVPEPSMFALAICGIAAILGMSGRRRR